MNGTYGRCEKRRVHNAVGGTRATQQQTVSSIHEGYKKEKGLNVMKTLGIVGATGAVGQTALEILEQRGSPFSHIKLYASKASAGKLISFGQTKILVEETNIDSLLECDAVLFATDSHVSLEFIPRLAEKGILCVDKSSAFRADPRIPLIVPEVNGSLLFKEGLRSLPIVASPNCCTIPLVMVLKALDDAFSVKKTIVSTYQSVSGSGKPGVDILTQETKDFFNMPDLSCQKSFVFPKSIAFNVMPFVASILENGDTDEESKIMFETKKVLDKPNFPIAATSVRVPTFVGHGESVTLELGKNFDILKVIETLSKFPGLRVVDEQKREQTFVVPQEDEDNLPEDFVTPREAHGRDEVFVSRIRKCEVFENGLSLWIVSDNLRKGAALNALQIIELFYSLA
jgi:aspartate-semialdehyde dehydrogenase